MTRDCVTVVAVTLSVGVHSGAACRRSPSQDGGQPPGSDDHNESGAPGASSRPSTTTWRSHPRAASRQRRDKSAAVPSPPARAAPRPGSRTSPPVAPSGSTTQVTLTEPTGPDDAPSSRLLVDNRTDMARDHRGRRSCPGRPRYRPGLTPVIACEPHPRPPASAVRGAAPAGAAVEARRAAAVGSATVVRLSRPRRPRSRRAESGEPRRVHPCPLAGGAARPHQPAPATSLE